MSVTVHDPIVPIDVGLHELAVLLAHVCGVDRHEVCASSTHLLAEWNSEREWLLLMLAHASYIERSRPDAAARKAHIHKHTHTDNLSP